jgi:hypothetical protein
MNTHIKDSWFEVHYNHPKRLKRMLNKYSSRIGQIINISEKLIKYDIMKSYDANFLVSEKLNAYKRTRLKLVVALSIHNDFKQPYNKHKTDNDLKEEIVTRIKSCECRFK